MADLTIGYAAMLEQFGPQEVLGYQVLAEQHGFSGSMAADHFQPWVPAQGEASFVWNVLTAIGERTRGDLGPGVTCPSFRFHPAIVAQAAATLEAMYPGRTWLGIGSGEALNEHMIGQYWPEAGERSLRMFEAVELIKKLFDASLAGKDVKHAGTYFTMESTRLWTMPSTPPPVLVATAGPINAKKTGKFADGIITVGAPLEKIGGLFDKFAEGAREAGKDPDTMPKVLQLHLSWAADRRGGARERDGPVAERRHEVPEGRHPLAARLRADGQARAARGLRGADAHLERPRRAPRLHPAVRRPRLRPGLPAQRRPQPGASGSRSSAATSCPKLHR